MIPRHLHISGFLSYHDPVDLDFDGVSLACISGNNGAGKSSLLDAITWALFGQARKRDDSLINAQSTFAEVILDFEYEGSIFRVQRSKPRDKTAVLEYFIQTTEGNWKVLTEKSLRETENRIGQTLRMDYETFTNASFFLQGKADQFATQRPGDRKRILSSILGLEIWETYRERTAARRKSVEGEVAALDGALREIQAELDEEPARQAALTRLQEELSRLSALTGAQSKALDSLRQASALLAEQRKVLEGMRGRVQTAEVNCRSLEQRLSARQAERETYQDSLQQAETIQTAYQAWQDARTALEHWEEVAARFREADSQRSAPLLEIQSERSRLEQELETLTALEEATLDTGKEVPQREGQLVQMQQAVADANSRLEERAALEQQIRDLHQQQADARAENPRLKAEMDELSERINRLKGTEGATCPLCGQPLSSDERAALVETLNVQGTDMGNRYRQNLALLKDFENRLNELETRHAGLGQAEQDLRHYTRQVDLIGARLEQIRLQRESWEENGAPRQAEIRRLLTEESFAAPARARLAQIDAGLKAIGYDAAAHDAVRRAEQQGRSSEGELRALENARAALAPLEREIGEMESELAKNRQELTRQQDELTTFETSYRDLSENTPDLLQAEAELRRQLEQENRLRMEVGAARQKVLVLDRQRERLARLKEQRDGFTRQISQLKTLERAFSKDGVPALLIEQALPEIEDQANKILDRLSGGTMSVRFNTQREYKDKNRDDKKETLDILISDSVGTRDYEMFSGGEAFRVNFAIRLALSRVLAQRAGARLQTLVIDEGFGSQDEQGRQRLIEAINLVSKDFARILVITHLEELKDAFPTRIEVEKTLHGSTVQVV